MRIPNPETLATHYPGVRWHVREGILMRFGDWRVGDDEAGLPFTQAEVDAWGVPTEAQHLAAEHPELPGTVRAAFAALQSLVSMGVNLDLSSGLPGWQHIGPAIAARRMELATVPEAYAALDAAADLADGYWRAVVTWCGDYATAYRLAPELAAIGV